ncbi:MAG: type I-C CRISPR-associated protein Cas7/Csd2 [Acidobacteria bacterium]|nr:type I-C CRISPR-associated protein Cas7/Csd2 [Acidobacteriota bacterium]
MSTLQNKIDFAAIVRVKHANPNGDPLNGNRPRTDYSGYGEITDVCLKRKVRDRLLDAGYGIFVQSDDRKKDDAKSLRDRAEKTLGGKFGSADTARLACQTWFDVRAFGQLFAMPKKSKSRAKDAAAPSEEGDTGLSIPIRGPVTIQSAFSIDPVEVTSTQITKSVSSDGDGTKRGSDTMGMKHRVDNGIYVFYGSMNPQLAERTGFSDADAAALKSILPRIFENDASSARPEGSMEVLQVFWWKHDSKAGQYSSAKVHRTLTVKGDGSFSLADLPGLVPEQIPGF